MRIGTSARGGVRNPDPLRHIWTGRPASRTGVCVLALCGTQIRPSIRDDLGPWDPAHPRACPACATAVIERAAGIARRHAT